MSNLVTTISNTVVFLFAGTPVRPVGTAFVVGFPNPAKQEEFIPLLVTAKHVLGDLKQVFGRFSTQAATSTALVEYDLEKLKADGDYWEHTDDGVDIAVFRSRHHSVTRYSNIPPRLIASKEVLADEGIAQTDHVIFPCLLTNFMGLNQNYPVIRHGSIALIPDEDVPMRYEVGTKTINTRQRVIMVDATSIPGASGSPVFHWPDIKLRDNAYKIGGTPTYLLGIMHGFYNANPREVAQVQTAGTKSVYAENSGIAIIFPAWRILEIINRPELQDRMNSLFSPPPPSPLSAPPAGSLAP